jgi:hypothetical protein
MRALLIDSKKRTISEVKVKGLGDMQKRVGGLITIAHELPISEDESDTIFVNDEALLGEMPEHWFHIEGAHQPFAGNGLVVGADHSTGDSTDASISLRDLKKIVTFMSGPDVAIWARFHQNPSAKEKIKKSITVYYETWDHDSIDAGDTDDRGEWDHVEIEADEMDLDDGKPDSVLAAHYLMDNGPVESSSSQWHPGVWYTSIDAEEDYKTGEKTYYSFHLTGFDEGESREIFDLIKRGKRR